MWSYQYWNALTHHGVLGMKWGVRKEPELLGRSTHSKQKPKEKSKRHLKLEDKYRAKGMSQDDAEKAAAKRAKVEKFLKVAAVITVVAATAYVAKKGLLALVEIDRQEKMKLIFDTAKNNGIMDISDLPRIKGDHGMLDDLKAVNQRYGATTLLRKASDKKKYNVWQKNCGYCATAFEMRRRGFDVEAVSNGSGMGLGTTPSSLFEGMEWKKSSKPSEGYFAVMKEARNWSDGARGMVHVLWKGGGGHAFSFEMKDGYPDFIDAQTNDTAAVRYFNSAKKVIFARTDNLELKENILNAVKLTRR